VFEDSFILPKWPEIHRAGIFKIHSVHMQAVSSCFMGARRGTTSKPVRLGFRIEVELRVGGSVRILPPKDPEVYGDHAGKVIACEPGRKLTYTFCSKDKPEVAKKRESPSRVTYELTPIGPLVRLRLIHENLLPEDLEKDPNTFHGINNGWPAIMSSLKSLLETGEPITFSPC
jgi:uncharacterized protein YndB with AHSA1/START domain